MSEASRIFLGNTVFRISFEDEGFQSCLESVFPSKPSSEGREVVEILVKGFGYHDIERDGNTVQMNLNDHETAYWLSLVFGEKIRANVTTTICTLHASSVAVDGKAIVFVGDSGSGKTTLSLLSSAHENYIGDEYAWLDLVSGELWHESYPAQIKEGSRHLFPDYDFATALHLESGEFGTSYLLPMEGNMELRKHFPLKALVFPRFDASVEQTTVTKMPISEFCEQILESAASSESPALLLRRLLLLISAREVRLIKLSFSDSHDARARLAATIEEGVEYGLCLE